MKKVFFTAVILSVIFIGCKDKKQDKIETSVETEMHSEHGMHADHESEVLALSNAWLDEIELNQGAKWEANSETTDGVNKMVEIMKNHTPNTVEEYHKLANELNDQKNYIVKECTMTGPSHDNLHVFLHPLIEKIDALLAVENLEKAKEITTSIDDNINEYYNYFQ